jgi:hypothetical protein
VELGDRWTATSIVSAGQGGGKSVMLKLSVEPWILMFGILLHSRREGWWRQYQGCEMAGNKVVSAVWDEIIAAVFPIPRTQVPQASAISRGFVS